MTRWNQVLSVLLVIQIVLAIAMLWPQSTVSSAEAGPLLPGFDAGQVVSLTLTDSEGNHVTLAKASEGWVLPEAGDYPADGEKVSSLLDKLGSIQTNRQVTRTASSHKRLKVAEDDFVRLIEFALANGETHKVFVGSSPRTSATHVRADNQPETYLTADLPSYEVSASAARWIDTLYYTVPQTDTVALTLENENGRFEFERDGEQWVMAGLDSDEEFDQSAFNSLLGQVTSLRMLEPIGKEEEPSFELDQPRATMTLKMGDGQTHTLYVGAKEEEGARYVAKWSESPYYVWIAEYTADNLMNKTRQDFIAEPATPTPTPETDSGSDGG
ncbi:MAG: hypothetical protein Kow0063_07260 [Anaerolineae bacterium]